MIHTLILNLLLINLIVSMVYMSGFWDSLDYYLNKRLKPYHLPHIFQCTLCQTFWLSLIYILIAHTPILLGIVLSLINAHLSEITIPLLTSIKEWLKRLIEWTLPR